MATPPYLALYHADGARQKPGRSSRLRAVRVEYQRVLYSQGLDVMQREFEEQTWQAFPATAVQDRKATAVAAELGLSVPAVYQARSRVRRRLQVELASLLE